MKNLIKLEKNTNIVIIFFQKAELYSLIVLFLIGGYLVLSTGSPPKKGGIVNDCIIPYRVKTHIPIGEISHMLDK